jgi:hypothetical protein
MRISAAAMRGTLFFATAGEKEVCNGAGGVD